MVYKDNEFLNWFSEQTRTTKPRISVGGDDVPIWKCIDADDFDSLINRDGPVLDVIMFSRKDFDRVEQMLRKFQGAY